MLFKMFSCTFHVETMFSCKLFVFVYVFVFQLVAAFFQEFLR